MGEAGAADKTVQEERILGTFSSPGETTKALEALREAGLQDLTLYSPIDPGEAGIPVTRRKSRIGRFTLAGVFMGILAGLFLGGGTAILYPIETGGMPILSLPAVGLMTFEVMILFSLLATISGFLYFAIFSANRKQFVPECVSSDRFGISVRGNQKELDSAEAVLRRCGADRIAKQVARLWLGVLLAFALPFLLLPSPVMAWPWSQDMVDQPARDPQEERFFTLPSIVPRQGRSIRATKKTAPSVENPIPVTERSLQIGKRLFEVFCVVCHGAEGKGDGIVAEKIGEFPDFTEEEFRSQPDGCFYVAMTEGSNFISEISRPRPPLNGVSHDDHDESEHAHDEGEEHEGEEEEHEHQHDDAASSDPAHEDDHGDEHQHDDEMTSMKHEDDHAHDEMEHEHDEMEHKEEHAHEEEHEHEHEHEHAAEGPQCGTGHEHGEGGGHKHGSGKKHFMPPYRDALRPIERWHIVNYLKHGLVRK